MRICYLTRTDRGACVTGVRLFGAQTDGRWSASLAADTGADAAIRYAEEAGAWVAERLASARPARFLDAVCIDSDGGICTWLTVPSGAPAVVAAAFAQAGAGDLAAAGEAEAGVAPAVQALPAVSGGVARAKKPRRGAPAEEEGERVAVMALQDAAVRLFLDALDARRVTTARVFSIWHALAEAWDPGAGGAPEGPKAERIVAAGSPLSAVVMLEPAGRVVWVWGRGGEVIAGGSMRLTRAHTQEDEEGGPCRVGPADMGRLCADWLAWSAQIGTVPSRIVCVGPPGEPGSESALATLASGLRAAWPEAAVAATAEADPVAATFHRLAQRASAPSELDPGRAMPALSCLPGRMHRAMHLWGAFAFVACAAVCGVLAFRAQSAAADLREEASSIQDETKRAVQEFDPEIAGSDFWLRELRSELENRTAPQARAPRTEPILPELENIALVLGGFASEGVEPVEITLDIVPMVKVKVPNLEMADEVSNAFLRGMRSAIQWRRTVGGVRPDQIEVTLTGVWATARPAPEGGGE